MSSFRPLGPFPQYFLADGTVNNGGLITFYETDLSTLQNTYSDEGLTVPNTNPVVLDASGRPTTDIWGGSAYGVVITDSLGANPRTVNNVEPYSGAGAVIPTLVDGDFLTNDGSNLLWQVINQLPDPTGSAGKWITTDGTLFSWATLPSSTTVSGAAGIIIVGAVTIQYGTASVAQPSSGSKTATGTVTFPTPFSAIGGFWLTYTGGSATVSGGNPIGRAASSATSATVQFDINDFASDSGGINTSLPFQWLAIGLT
jgi:hypothetical protein